MDDVSDEDVAFREETGAGRRSTNGARRMPAALELEPELQALVKTLRKVPPLPTAVRVRALARARAVLDRTKTESQSETTSAPRKPGRAPRDVSNASQGKFPARRPVITKTP